MRKKKKEKELYPNYTQIDWIADMIYHSHLRSFEVELLQDVLKKLTADVHQEQFEDITVDELKLGLVRWKKTHGAAMLEYFLENET